MSNDNGVRGNSGQRKNHNKGRGNEMEVGVGVDKDLTMGKRRLKWRIVEAEKGERAKGRRVMVTNREL